MSLHSLLFELHGFVLAIGPKGGTLGVVSHDAVAVLFLFVSISFPFGRHWPLGVDFRFRCKINIFGAFSSP